MRDLLKETAERAARYLENLDGRPVAPTMQAIENLKKFNFPMPQQPAHPSQVLALLDEIGSPATVATTGRRYFGFVIGGALPATLAANWLAGAWDQCAGLVTLSPVAAYLEEVALKWLVDIFALPKGSGGGFVTGATMANFTCLAAARHAVLAQVGWDVEAQGLFGAPPITVVVGGDVHVSLIKALGHLGLGRERVVRVAADSQGRMRVDALPKFAGPAIVCIQAGEVNTGAFDPAAELCARAHDGGAWVHVDGAFGLWAAAAPARAHLLKGFAEADSWATDAHKWLNVPYDSGIALVRDAKNLMAAMSMDAAYLVHVQEREPNCTVPEMSRRARGVEIWAALMSLGRSGLADLIERNCRYAERFAEVLAAAGWSVLNEVSLNQVLVSFGDDATTRRVIAALQSDGTCWCSGTVWRGRAAMRISVSSWATTEEDVEQSLAAMLRIAAAEARR
ncbi:MAG TPA: aminotransferase class V-fold PLP-dependent enzyme [Terriglobia bacterium]|nr:aminotransferase class V-fold PLP-dependent enzyme [Terriglobia bacterium]